MKVQPLINCWNEYDHYNRLVDPPSRTNFVDGGKNPRKKRETLPFPQVPIRLTNIWYGKIDGIMDSLPSKFGGLVCFKSQEC